MAEQGLILKLLKYEIKWGEEEKSSGVPIGKEGALPMEGERG